MIIHMFDKLEPHNTNQLLIMGNDNSKIDTLFKKLEPLDFHIDRAHNYEELIYRSKLYKYDILFFSSDLSKLNPFTLASEFQNKKYAADIVLLNEDTNAVIEKAHQVGICDAIILGL